MKDKKKNAHNVQMGKFYSVVINNEEIYFRNESFANDFANDKNVSVKTYEVTELEIENMFLNGLFCDTKPNIDDKPTEEKTELPVKNEIDLFELVENLQNRINALEVENIELKNKKKVSLSDAIVLHAEREKYFNHINSFSRTQTVLKHAKDELKKVESFDDSKIFKLTLNATDINNGNVVTAFNISNVLVINTVIDAVEKAISLNIEKIDRKIDEIENMF